MLCIINSKKIIYIFRFYLLKVCIKLHENGLFVKFSIKIHFNENPIQFHETLLHDTATSHSILKILYNCLIQNYIPIILMDNVL